MKPIKQIINPVLIGVCKYHKNHPTDMLTQMNIDIEKVPAQTLYRVYNKDKSKCFETTEFQLAYEVRKGSSSNCYSRDGEFNNEAFDFCETWGMEDCSLEIIERWIYER